MLQDLIELLDRHYPGQLKPIADLAKSCCDSSKPVYDLDAIKDATLLGKTACKSADALLLVATEGAEECRFVEMKDMTTFETRLKANLPEHIPPTPEAFKQAFRETFVHEFELDKKVFDSVLLLLDICAKYSINTTFYPFWIKDTCKKEFWFVLKISTRDFVQFRLSILDALYRARYYKMPIKFIPAVNFDQPTP